MSLLEKSVMECLKERGSCGLGRGGETPSKDIRMVFVCLWVTG